MARHYTQWKQYRLSHTSMRNESRRRYYAKHRKNKVRSGARWTDEENAMVILHAFSDVALKSDSQNRPGHPASTLQAQEGVSMREDRIEAF